MNNNAYNLLTPKLYGISQLLKRLGLSLNFR